VKPAPISYYRGRLLPQVPELLVVIELMLPADDRRGRRHRSSR
jgi:hypothetical protein